MSEMFFAGHEMTHPYTSGKYMKDYTLDQLREMSPEITPEEMADEFYKYYSEEMADIEPQHKAAIEHGPLSPELCYMPKEAGNLLLCGSDVFPENGYGVLPNGVGFASILIHQTGITEDMIRYYRENFAHTKNRLLFYKLWYPHMHLIHFEDGIVENWGWGMCRQDMNMEDFCFSHLGISRDDILEKDPDCIGLLGAGGRCVELARPDRKDWPMWMIQHTRLMPWGRELRVRYWNGLDFKKDGSFVLEANSDREQTLKEMKMMMTHCMYEYCNEQKLMKTFWEARG